MSDRFTRAIALIDEANAEDPNREASDGKDHPAEWLYGRRMTEWLERLDPDAPEHVRLAARAQHVGRWRIPRDEYPPGRRGYHQWRTRLYAHHADTAEELLGQAGYDDETLARVRDLLMKRNLRTDPEMQLLEDVICLVFLEHYFSAFAEEHDDDKLVRILERTLKKMTARGRREALRIALPERERRLVERATEG